MLYSLAWDKTVETKPSADTIYSLDVLIAWLREQDPAQSYDATKPSTCLLGQYLSACGVENVAYASVKLGTTQPFRSIALDHFTAWTFGAALERALAIKESSYATL